MKTYGTITCRTCGVLVSAFGGELPLGPTMPDPAYLEDVTEKHATVHRCARPDLAVAEVDAKAWEAAVDAIRARGPGRAGLIFQDRSGALAGEIVNPSTTHRPRAGDDPFSAVHK